jgi:uncharacterized protein (TIGR01777 family)
MPPSTIVVSGASGLVGSALVPALERAGHHVLRLVRRETQNAREIRWTPAAHLFDERQLGSVDVVVNLAGETIGRRWTAARRRRIRESRVAGTETIVAAIAKSGRPITLINASAVGYYGDRGDALLDESSSSGRGFLAEICRQWEGAARTAAHSGSRVVMMRSGVVLSEKGGALPRMLMPFRFGVGGKISNGRHWLSWISLDDMAQAIVWLIDHPEIQGPINMCAPNPVTNADFTRAAGRALHRPTLFPVPGFVLRLIFGEMADETLLVSQRAVPGVLVKSGFTFGKPTIEEALRSVITSEARDL